MVSLTTTSQAKPTSYSLGSQNDIPHNYNMLWSGMWKEFWLSAAEPKGCELPMSRGDISRCFLLLLHFSVVKGLN